MCYTNLPITAEECDTKHVLFICWDLISGIHNIFNIFCHLTFVSFQFNLVTCILLTVKGDLNDLQHDFYCCIAYHIRYSCLALVIRQ
uniref:Uncharacterized protein n=1 Tax=Arundo donax TaxID=35708 RepID=A0A0A9GXB9_ARUDO